MESFFPKLIYMSLTGSVLILAALILRKLLKRAPKWTVLLLWALAALRLVMPFAPESRFSLIPEGAEEYVYDKLAVSAEASPGPTLRPSPAAVPGTETDKAAGRPQSTAAAVPAATEKDAPEVTRAPHADAPEKTEAAAPAPIAGTQDKPGGKRGLLLAAAYIWAAGLAAMAAYAVISRIALSRKLVTAVRLSDGVYESENVASPFLLGLIRPRIYLPFGLDEKSRGFVLEHERAHIKGLDHLWKPLGFAILSLHWFNPLAWFAYAAFCRDIELSCDERVAKRLGERERAEYSQTLLDLSVPRRRITACPLAFGESNTKERVKNMMNYKKPAFWIIIAALAALCLLAVCFLTKPKRATEHRFIMMTEVMELAEENGWVVIPDDTSCSISKGEKEWFAFLNKSNAGEPAEVVVAIKAEGPVTGKYSDLEDTHGDRTVIFKKVTFDGKKYTLSESSVYPLDFENSRSFDGLFRSNYPDGGCWLYYLADREPEKLREENTEESFASALYEVGAFPLLKLKFDFASYYGKGWFDIDGDGAEELLCLGMTPTGMGYKELAAYFGGVKYTAYLLCDDTPSVASKDGRPMLKVGGELIPIGFEDGRLTLGESGSILFFKSWTEQVSRLSELPREEIIAFLKDNEIYVDPLYYDESFDLNEAVKAVEGIPEAMWEADGIPYYTQYDLNYAAGLYDGSIEMPAKPLLSHMGEEGCLEKLREIGVTIPEELDFDLRSWVKGFEEDINTKSPFAGENSWRSILFSDVRCMLFEYYEMSWLMLSEYRTDLAGYTEAALGLPRGEGGDWFRGHWSSGITLALSEGRFRAWDGRREYVEKTASDSYRFEYEGLLAEYPAELWDIASEKLSNYQYEYMHWGWEPGQPYVGPYPDGLISGGDSVLCEGEPWHDRQVNVILHRFEDGEWREFGNSNIGYAFTPTGMCILNDTTGFVCYGNRWEYKNCEGEHEPNWVNVFATYDGGNTWKNLDLTLPDEFLDTDVAPIALSPVFEGEIGVIPVIKYTATGSLRVAWFVTGDGGVTWSYGGCSTSDSERMTLSFDKLIPPISAEFDLPYPLILRTEKGSETFIHIFVYPEDGGYIYDTEGRLVGCFKASPGEISDDPHIAFCFITGGHWRVLIDEMYEPVENDYGCEAAITLAWGVDVIPGQSFAENEYRLCDAVIARNPETGAVFELVFDKDMLTREQLEAIARSIHVK